MSNIIPPMVSSSPPPMDDNIDDDEDDEFGDFASANLSYDIGGDDEDEEDYVEYGTPLEPLDEDAPVRKKPFSAVAKDSHGRRRFHGAFTGGFSAGFFNTVSSLEGWTPSSFKSSRSERTGVKTQRPEDFMDDEDVGEFGIAPSVLRARSDFSDERHKRKREGVHLSDGPIPGKPALEDLLEPVRETVGIRLLRRMGWRPGQGVGPRVSKAEKKRSKRLQKKTAGRVYGCELPSDLPASDSDCSDEEEMLKNITFAPDDCEQVMYKLKDDVFGIGYTGLDKRPILSRHINLFEPSSLVMKEKQKKISISGQAFGVGALEDEDEDIYAREDMTQYDFSLEEPSSSHKQRPTSQFSQDKTFGDVLEGFVHRCTISSNKRHFPPPELPPGFQPFHDVHQNRFEPDTRKKIVKQQVLTAEHRTAILSEQFAAPTPQGSNKAKEKHPLTDEALKITENLLPVMSEETGRFKPFTSDPAKQKRYEQYTALVRIGQKEKLASLQPLDMTEWEKERERAEFEQAVKLFTPLTGPMSDRFVSAAQPDDNTNPLAPVERLVDENAERKAAAKMKMFGHLTRERTPWQPCSLLLKRFNIAEPNIAKVPTSATSKKRSQFSVFDYLDASALNKPKTLEEVKPAETLVETTSATSKKPSQFSVFDYLDASALDKPKTLEEVEPDETLVETLPNEEIKEEKKEDSKQSAEPEEEITFPDPPEKIDLYRAIFLSSSDESEEDEDEKEEENVKIGDVEEKTKEDLPMERNTSPPRGVFANLDLDAINARKPVQPVTEQSSPPKSPEVIPTNGEVKQIVTSEEDSDIYGPKLPTQPLPQRPAQASVNVVPITYVMPQGEWVEKRKKHKNKHHKKEHKKSSKHKSKKSKKKR
ncbi:G patch domain-containing protein 1 homolog [Anabrus simplex]|uniref:G patch domain-containing protein 1 homolog n=1 Tax=Anabrus simplex TaxID=316456 RepID=UPI0035A34D4C